MSQLISIIIPVYKVEAYLERCLNSILNQTYAYTEIILIDDGSPDSSPQICDSYKKKDSRITVIHQKNQGLSAARNRGLDIAHGDFVTFIDSDDWVSTEYLEELHASIIEAQADIAIINHKHTTSFPDKQNETKRSIKVFSRNEALFELIAKQNQPFVISCGKLYRTRIFKSIRFPAGKYHEDEFTSHFLINAATKIVYSNKVLYFYYQRPNSITKQDHISDIIEAFENRLDFIINSNHKNLASYAAANLCWKYLNLSYRRYLNKEDYTQPLKKVQEIKHLINFKRITDICLFIFWKHPKLYFFVKKIKC